MANANTNNTATDLVDFGTFGNATVAADKLNDEDTKGYMYEASVATIDGKKGFIIVIYNEVCQELGYVMA